MTIVQRSWASAHLSWADACQSAYAYLEASCSVAEREVAEITALEPQRVESVHGRDVMVWSTWLHLPDRPRVIRYDVLDNRTDH